MPDEYGELAELGHAQYSYMHARRYSTFGFITELWATAAVHYIKLLSSFHYKLAKENSELRKKVSMLENKLQDIQYIVEEPNNA